MSYKVLMASHLILTPVQSLSKKTCCVFNRWKNVETHLHDFTRTMTSTPEYETSLFSDSSTTQFSDHRDRSTTPLLFIPLLVKQQEVHKLQGHGLVFNQQSTDHHRQAAQVLHITCLPVSVCFSRTQLHIRQWSGNCPCFSHFGNGSRSPHQHSQPAICELRFNVCS